MNNTAQNIWNEITNKDSTTNNIIGAMGNLNSAKNASNGFDRTRNILSLITSIGAMV